MSLITSNAFASVLVFYHESKISKLTQQDLIKIANKYSSKPEKLLSDLFTKYNLPIPTSVAFDEVERICNLYSVPDEYLLLLPSTLRNKRDNENRVKESRKTVQSAWIQKFLLTKREMKYVPPMEVEPLNNQYIEAFFKRSNIVENNAKEEIHPPIDETLSSKTNFDLSDASQDINVIERIIAHRSKPDIIISLDDSIDCVSPISHIPSDRYITSPSSNTLLKYAKLRITNLPYDIQEEEVISLGAKYGFEFSVLLKDSKIGSATVSLLLNNSSTSDRCIEVFLGKEFQGRKLRIKNIDNETFDSYVCGGVGGSGTKRLSRMGRYHLSNDITSKCLYCGEVGHRQQQCTALDDLIESGSADYHRHQPCYICGGADHQAGDCSNVVCHGCKYFGHHIRDCHQHHHHHQQQQCARPSPWQRLCTFCGSQGHNTTFCYSLTRPTTSPSSSSAALLTGPAIRCCCCHATGHSCCSPTAVPLEPALHCPACGGSGHHHSLPALGSSCPLLPQSQVPLNCLPELPPFSLHDDSDTDVVMDEAGEDDAYDPFNCLPE